MIGTVQELLSPFTPEIPDLSIAIQENEEAYGRSIVEPLERGRGATLGNALRRTLLNSLPGTAITWVRIGGALHEYSTIPHMPEDRPSSRVIQARLEGALDVDHAPSAAHDPMDFMRASVG